MSDIIDDWGSQGTGDKSTLGVLGTGRIMACLCWIMWTRSELKNIKLIVNENFCQHSFHEIY